MWVLLYCAYTTQNLYLKSNSKIHLPVCFKHKALKGQASICVAFFPGSVPKLGVFLVVLYEDLAGSSSSY
jgi:hypothetical protein